MSPYFPRSFPTHPEALQKSEIAECIHALPELVVPIGHQLSLSGQWLHRLVLPTGLVTSNIRQNVGLRTKNPPLIHPSPICGFSVNSAIRSPSKTKPPKRAGGRTAVVVASLPWWR